jgi:1-acyl-sn-glycerol-3-phosphate acyltransferase
LLRWIFNALYAILTVRDVEGLENIPPPPYLAVTNHLSYADPPLIYSYIGGKHLAAWVADKYRRHLFFGTIVRFANPIFIRRGLVDRAALDEAVGRLRSGLAFGLAPEGTRSATGALARAKTGAAYLADASQIPLLPIAVHGTETAFKKLARFQRPHLSIRFGPTFTLPPVDEADRSAGLRRNTDEIMLRIAALLPHQYRGYYADHSRLEEFTEQQSLSSEKSSISTTADLH